MENCHQEIRVSFIGFVVQFMHHFEYINLNHTSNFADIFSMSYKYSKFSLMVHIILTYINIQNFLRPTPIWDQRCIFFFFVSINLVHIKRAAVFFQFEFKVLLLITIKVACLSLSLVTCTEIYHE